MVLYLVWLYGDRDTPQAGGRRLDWVRKWAIWRHFRDYFPMSVRAPWNNVLEWGPGFKIDSSCPHPPKSNSPCAPSALQLIKTAELDPSRNYLFAFHPHGVLVTGAFCSFCTEATGFSRLFPGLKPHLLMLPCWFYLPLFRDYIMCAGEERGEPGLRTPSPRCHL